MRRVALAPAHGKPLLACLAFAACLGAAGRAPAVEPNAPMPQRTQRTASWYEANPGVMRRVLAACRNDPGHGRNDPDCINARAGEVLEAEKAARRAAGMGANPFVSPDNPRYWIIHPDELPGKLYRCSKMPPEAQRAYSCDAARAAAGRSAAR